MGRRPTGRPSITLVVVLGRAAGVSLSPLSRALHTTTFIATQQSTIFIATQQSTICIVGHMAPPDLEAMEASCRGLDEMVTSGHREASWLLWSLHPGV